MAVVEAIAMVVAVVGSKAVGAVTDGGVASKRREKYYDDD